MATMADSPLNFLETHYTYIKINLKLKKCIVGRPLYSLCIKFQSSIYFSKIQNHLHGSRWVNNRCIAMVTYLCKRALLVEFGTLKLYYDFWKEYTMVLENKVWSIFQWKIYVMLCCKTCTVFLCHRQNYANLTMTLMVNFKEACTQSWTQKKTAFHSSWNKGK